HMSHHHQDALLPPSVPSPEQSVLSTAAAATTTATATTPAPQPWPGFEPPRPLLPPLLPYQHPHSHRDPLDSGRLQQQQQQHLFPSGDVAVEAGAAPPAGFAGLAGAGGFGSALAAIPTAGWAEPIRQLYALLDYVAMQEAMVSGRLTTLRVHWINRPPALAHQAVEVVTVPQDCTLGYLKRLICKASGGAVWPRTVQPMRQDPSQGPAAPLHQEGASVPTQGPCVHSVAAPLQPLSAAERPFACSHLHGVRSGDADAGGGGTDEFNNSGAAANSARPATAAGSGQPAQQTAAFLTESLLPLNPDCGDIQGRWDPAVPAPSVPPQCQGVGVTGGDHQGGRVNAADSGITGDGSTGQGGGGDATGQGAGAGEGGSGDSVEGDASTLAEAGILPDSNVVMEADLQLPPSHQQLLMALQSQVMAAAAAVSTGLPGFHNPLQGSLPTAAAAAAAAAVAVTASVVAAANQPSSSTGLMGLTAEAGGDGEGDGADGHGGREFRGTHKDGAGSSRSRLPRGNYGGTLKERFTLQEMSALVSGIEEFGLKWALIKKSRKELQNKNQGDLKDKWRNWQRNVAVSWLTSRVTLPDQLRGRINALVAAAQRGELPTHTTPNLHVLQQRVCGMTAFQQHHSNPQHELQQQPPPQQQQQQQQQQQSGPEALSLQASTALAAVAAAAAAAAAMATGRPSTAGAAPMPADEAASRGLEMPVPTLDAEAVQGQGQARPSQQQPQQQEQMISITSVAPAARCGRQQQFSLQAGAAQSGASGGHQVSDHPHQHQHQGQEEGKGEDEAARAAQRQLQLQEAQAAQIAKAAQEAQAQAQAQLAAAAAAVAAAAAGQVDGRCGADMGLHARIQLAPHGSGHTADALRCIGLPLALPLSLAVPSSDEVPRLLLPAPAAAVAGIPVPGGPPGNASTHVEGGSGAAIEPGGDVQQSHEPAHQGYNLAAAMEDITTRGSVPEALVSQLGLGHGHLGPLER
ncbi:hypothetical protein VaNZ11_012891, partial [Volvox africanus]